MIFQRIMLLVAAVGSGALAIDTAIRYASPFYAIFGASLYVVAAVVLAAAGAILA